MTLEQYEALLAEKKAELNKARVVKTVDTSEFDKLKIVSKDEEEEENPLEVRGSSTSRDAAQAAGNRSREEVGASRQGTGQKGTGGKQYAAHNRAGQGRKRR